MKKPIHNQTIINLLRTIRNAFIYPTFDIFLDDVLGHLHDQSDEKELARLAKKAWTGDNSED